MSQQGIRWRMAKYEDFEIHVTTVVKGHEDETAQQRAPMPGDRYTFIGYVCHPGADPDLPGHTVAFHADGEETYASAEAAWEEGVRAGRSIVDGTHPDLTVLSLVTSGF
ncbi:MAG TPA: hypothetical protein VL598_12870 [Trinickia sp.]|uniref:hypothetical protein n=1 Tax=Trinickia sp. TaxID=2571163 RepID=UPI002BEF4571|nr:hypothetical protein [Trinickia sp.]HTI18551.1 hypothetical protein [Trinickia sp.]